MLDRRAVVAVVLAGGVVLAACSSGGSGGYGSSSTQPKSRYGTGSGGKSTTTTAETAAAGATVKVGDTSLGQVLTDAKGRTLYLYASDEGTTSKVPTGVLAAWPPVKASGTPTAGSGLDAAKVTTAKQANGQEWVAYNGHLLYSYAGDTAAGDVNGQGLGNVWYAVTPQGDKLAS